MNTVLYIKEVYGRRESTYSIEYTHPEMLELFTGAERATLDAGKPLKRTSRLGLDSTTIVSATALALKALA